MIKKGCSGHQSEKTSLGKDWNSFTAEGTLAADKEVCVGAEGWGGFVGRWGRGQQKCAEL